MEAEVRRALGDLPVAPDLGARRSSPGAPPTSSSTCWSRPATGLDLAAADRLRGAVIAALAGRYAPVVADVVFTAVEAYAAPTAGYTAGPA